MENKLSISPSGEQFTIPAKETYPAELERMEKLAADAKAKGQEVVVVMGLGFVGVVMAAIVADTKDEKGNYSKFVIGYQRPSERSYWKIPVVNQGVSPVTAEDPEVAELIERTYPVYSAFINGYCVYSIIR